MVICLFSLRSLHSNPCKTIEKPHLKPNTKSGDWGLNYIQCATNGGGLVVALVWQQPRPGERWVRATVGDDAFIHSFIQLPAPVIPAGLSAPLRGARPGKRPARWPCSLSSHALQTGARWQIPSAPSTQSRSGDESGEGEWGCHVSSWSRLIRSVWVMHPHPPHFRLRAHPRLHAAATLHVAAGTSKPRFFAGKWIFQQQISRPVLTCGYMFTTLFIPFTPGYFNST